MPDGGDDSLERTLALFSGLKSDPAAPAAPAAEPEQQPNPTGTVLRAPLATAPAAPAPADILRRRAQDLIGAVAADILALSPALPLDEQVRNSRTLTIARQIAADPFTTANAAEEAKDSVNRAAMGAIQVCHDASSPDYESDAERFAAIARIGLLALRDEPDFIRGPHPATVFEDLVDEQSELLNAPEHASDLDPAIADLVSAVSMTAHSKTNALLEQVALAIRSKHPYISDLDNYLALQKDEMEDSLSPDLFVPHPQDVWEQDEQIAHAAAAAANLLKTDPGAWEAFVDRFARSPVYDAVRAATASCMGRAPSNDALWDIDVPFFDLYGNGKDGQPLDGRAATIALEAILADGSPLEPSKPSRATDILRAVTLANAIHREIGDTDKAIRSAKQRLAGDTDEIYLQAARALYAEGTVPRAAGQRSALQTWARAGRRPADPADPAAHPAGSDERLALMLQFWEPTRIANALARDKIEEKTGPLARRFRKWLDRTEPTEPLAAKMVGIITHTHTAARYVERQSNDRIALLEKDSQRMSVALDRLNNAAKPAIGTFSVTVNDASLQRVALTTQGERDIMLCLHEHSRPDIRESLPSEERAAYRKLADRVLDKWNHPARCFIGLSNRDALYLATGYATAAMDTIMYVYDNHRSNDRMSFLAASSPLDPLGIEGLMTNEHRNPVLGRLDPDLAQAAISEFPKIKTAIDAALDLQAAQQQAGFLARRADVPEHSQPHEKPSFLPAGYRTTSSAVHTALAGITNAMSEFQRG